MEFLTVILVIVIVYLIFYFASGSDIRSRGVKTTGKISELDRQSWTDKYGHSHTTYYIKYQFQDDSGQSWTGKQSIGSAKGARVGQEITVYYLPNRPERNVAEL